MLFVASEKPSGGMQAETVNDVSLSIVTESSSCSGYLEEDLLLYSFRVILLYGCYASYHVGFITAISSE